VADSMGSHRLVMTNLQLQAIIPSISFNFQQNLNWRWFAWAAQSNPDAAGRLPVIHPSQSFVQPWCLSCHAQQQLVSKEKNCQQRKNDMQEKTNLQGKSWPGEGRTSGRSKMRATIRAMARPSQGMVCGFAECVRALGEGWLQPQNIILFQNKHRQIYLHQAWRRSAGLICSASHILLVARVIRAHLQRLPVVITQLLSTDCLLTGFFQAG
jgi:hypothetical protein